MAAGHGLPAGVLNVLKPPGMTSHDVVAWFRRTFGERRVGHAGTLDPLAAGVLLILCGPATRISAYLQTLPKAYRAEAVFGLETDAGDLDGAVVRREPCPSLSPEAVRQAIGGFRGRVRQRPPQRSAVKVSGVPLYRRARRGEQVEAPEREVWVERFDLVDWLADGAHPRAVLDIECSGGTYVRSLVRDLGRALGCGACLSFLLRTRVGPFGLDRALTLEEVAESVRPPVMPLAEALDFMPALELSADEARRVRNGHLPAAVAARLRGRHGQVRLLAPDGDLAAIAAAGPGGARLDRVFTDPPPVSGGRGE